MLGAGGSILTVPIFIYVLGIAPKAAIAMSLAAIGATSAIGAFSHWRHDLVDVRIALIFGGFAMGAAFVGARLARYVPEAVQLTLFGIVVLTAAVLMLRNAMRAPDERKVAADQAGDIGMTGEAPGAMAESVEGSGAPLDPAPRNGPRPRDLRWGWIALQGVAVGALTAVIGVGGGFLIVPALVLLGGVSMHRAVGTSLLIITINALSGFAGYLGQVPIDWVLVAGFAGAAGVGILVGGRLARHVSQRHLKQAFALLLLLVGAYVLYRR